MKPSTKYPTIAFFGNTKYSVIDAKTLNNKFGISLIVTIPDRNLGRHRKLTPNPIKKFVQSNNLPFFTFDKLDKKAQDKISKFKPNFIVVADYGLILPKELIALPKFVSLNVHHSLLPKYRGPSPAPAAILAGEKKTGVTIISMTEKVDAGDILAQKEYTVAQNETTDSLLTKLNTLGSQLVIDVIEKYPKGQIKPKKQNSSKATYTHFYKREDGWIDYKKPPDPVTFERMLRAFYPWPGVWTEIEAKTKDRKIRIKFLPNDPFLIQPEGKQPMTTKEFLNGHPQSRNFIEKLISNS